jgi:hypothetical protein
MERNGTERGLRGGGGGEKGGRVKGGVKRKPREAREALGLGQAECRAGSPPSKPAIDVSSSSTRGRTRSAFREDQQREIPHGRIHTRVCVWPSLLSIDGNWSHRAAVLCRRRNNEAASRERVISMTRFPLPLRKPRLVQRRVPRRGRWSRWASRERRHFYGRRSAMSLLRDGGSFLSFSDAFLDRPLETTRIEIARLDRSSPRGSASQERN